MRTNPREDDLFTTNFIMLYIFALIFTTEGQNAAKMALQMLGSSLNVLVLHWTVDCTGDFVSSLNKMESVFGSICIYNRRSELSLTPCIISLATGKPLTSRAT